MTNQNKIPHINATKNDNKNAINVVGRLAFGRLAFGRLAFVAGLLFFVSFVSPINAKNPTKKSTQNPQEIQNTKATKETKTTQSSVNNETSPAAQASANATKHTSTTDTHTTTQAMESSEQKEDAKKSNSIQSQPCNELCEYIRQKTSTTKHKNGYFIALNGGANVLEIYNKILWLPTFGLSFGVNSFFTPYIGVRGYVNADVGFGDYEGVLGMLSLGIEALAEFSLNRRKSVFLGGFLGFGVNGYVYYDKRDFSSFSAMQKSGGFYMQGGISFAFLRHNRLNIAARFIPARSVQNFSTAVFAFGQYSYTF